MIETGAVSEYCRWEGNQDSQETKVLLPDADSDVDLSGTSVSADESGMLWVFSKVWKLNGMETTEKNPL